MTQQHLSQIEKGKKQVSHELRRKLCHALSIPPETVGLAQRGPKVSRGGDVDAEVSASRGRWRAQRNWLNTHRSDLAKLAVQLYPEEYRVPRTPLIARPDWFRSEPVDLRSLSLELDEEPQSNAVTGKEEATTPTRPLRTADTRYDSYTAAIKHLDPPTLFESRPSYRLLDASLPERSLRFGLAAYFDKLDVSEALGHEMALACMDAPSGVPESPKELVGKLPRRTRRSGSVTGVGVS